MILDSRNNHNVINIIDIVIVTDRAAMKNKIITITNKITEHAINK